VNRSTTRSIRILLGIAAATLVAAGCGGGLSAGSAAVIGDSRITTAAVEDQISQINAARGLPADSVDAALTQATVQRLIITDLVDQAAVRLGAEVTEGAIDTEVIALETRAGGREELDQLLLESNIPPSGLKTQIRTSLLVQQMGAILDPQADPQVQSQLVYEYVVALSDELNVSVSPRFGVWNPIDLNLGAPPADLATPQAPEPVELEPLG
jgi:hypothetical protein